MQSTCPIDCSTASTVFFNNQTLLVSTTTTKKKLDDWQPSSSSSHLSISSSISCSSPLRLEITHNVILDNWLVSTVTSFQPKLINSSAITQEVKKKEEPSKQLESLPFPLFEVKKEEISENQLSELLDSLPLFSTTSPVKKQAQYQQPPSSYRKESTTAWESSLGYLSNEDSSSISQEDQPELVKQILKSPSKRQGISSFTSFHPSSSKSMGIIEEEGLDSVCHRQGRAVAMLKKPIQKLNQTSLIVSQNGNQVVVPISSSTSLQQTQSSTCFKRDRKNLVKNFIKAFRGFLSSAETKTEVVEIIRNDSAQLQGRTIDSELTRLRERFTSLIARKNFNNSLMVELIQCADFTDTLTFFLMRKAPEWIASSKIKDKQSHQEALNQYTMSLKDTVALSKVRCLKYRSTEALPDREDYFNINLHTPLH